MVFYFYIHAHPAFVHPPTGSLGSNLTYKHPFRFWSQVPCAGIGSLTTRTRAGQAARPADLLPDQGNQQGLSYWKPLLIFIFIFWLFFHPCSERHLPSQVTAASSLSGWFPSFWRLFLLFCASCALLCCPGERVEDKSSPCGQYHVLENMGKKINQK